MSVLAGGGTGASPPADGSFTPFQVNSEELIIIVLRVGIMFFTEKKIFDHHVDTGHRNAVRLGRVRIADLTK